MKPHLIVIVIAAISLLTLVTPVLATYVTVEQGSTVYMGDTCDISKVISWSGEWAYWDAGYPASNNPQKIVDFYNYGNMYNFKITADKGFAPGHWYKWEGSLQRSENADAFIIASGVRPEVTKMPIKPLENQSTSQNPVEELPVGKTQTVHLLLAKGDQNSLEYTFPSANTGYAGQEGHIWLFGQGSDTYVNGKPLSPNTLYGDLLTYTASDSTYTYTFKPEVSQTLQPGWYTGYLQFVGVNGKPDVYYDPIENSLYSPWKAVANKVLTGTVPSEMQKFFASMESNTTYSDDILVPISANIVYPSVSIGDYWEDSDHIVVEGSTPLATGSKVFVMIDPDQFKLKADILANTFTTTAKESNIMTNNTDCSVAIQTLNKAGYNVTSVKNPNLTEMGINTSVELKNLITTQQRCTDPPRIFSIAVPIKWENMAVTSHTIYAKVVTPNGVEATMQKDFLVSGDWVNPTPAPVYNKVILTKEGGASEPPSLNLSSIVANTTPTQVPGSNSTGTSRTIRYSNGTVVTVPGSGIKTSAVALSPQNSQPQTNASVNATATATVTKTPTPSESYDPDGNSYLDASAIGMPVNPVIPVIAIGLAIMGFVRYRKK